MNVCRCCKNAWRNKDDYERVARRLAYECVRYEWSANHVRVGAAVYVGSARLRGARDGAAGRGFHIAN